MNERKFELLECMRGLAALWVLMHHGAQATNHFVGSLGQVPLISNGYLGVDFFFLLSGFIIAFSTNRLINTENGIKTYFKARLIRIFIPYLPIGVGIYILYILLPGASDGHRTPGILTTLTLLPTNSPPALSVAWTLVHEMVFYFAYSLIFISRKLFICTMTLWVGAILAANFQSLPTSRFYEYFLSPLNLYFVIGVFLSTLVRHISLSRLLAIASCLIGVWLVGWQAASSVPDRTWRLYAVSSGT